MKKQIYTGLLCGSLFFLTACGGDGKSSDHKESGNNGNEIKNPVVSVEDYALNTEVLSPLSSLSKILTYKMQGIDGTETLATSLLFVPKTTPPKNGWPIVVWAHGTTGVADKCAPSKQGLTGNEYFIAKLLNAGYVVVAPDYEGLGSDGNHPFLNLKSEAYSITDAVVASKDYLTKQGKKVSSDWMAVGHSQGGHAALGAAQYADRAKLNYKGTIAIAPASNLKAILIGGEDSVKDKPFNEQIPVLAGLDTFTSLIVAGMQGHKTSVSYNEVFKNDLAKVAPLAESECYSDVGYALGGNMYDFALKNGNSIQNYGRTQDNFMSIKAIKEFLDVDSQPLTTKVSNPIIVYQGTHDETVPRPATDALIYQATQLKMQINYKTDDEISEKWTHTTVYTNNLDTFVEDIKTLMPIQ
jgi:pimeloyl-ACP methyl ester carboxylesterase